jgi:phosphoglycolate phosphatase-like HAD superfamily hydrolase
MTDRPLAIVDIDGVLADVRHRVHHVQGKPKDWDAFFSTMLADPPHQEGLDLVARVAEDHEVVFLTGRPEWTRDDTQAWLARHGLGEHRLEMRPLGDRRPAATVKVEMLAWIASGRRIGIVVDDDVRVVEAMRRAGHPVRHADWEPRDRSEQLALMEAQEVEGRS